MWLDLHAHHHTARRQPERDTGVLRQPAKGDTKQIRYYVEVEWDSRGIGEIAKKAGMTEVYYADLETLIVLGVWSQRFVHVYGR